MLFLITQYCTMGCKHCMTDATPEGVHASLETVEAFIDFAKELGTVKIGVSGGEPTSHPKFFDYFLKILESFGPSVEIVLMSNGQFLKENNFCETLSRLQAKYPFRIQISSIKGLYPEYEAVVDAYESQHKNFSAIDFVDELFYLENLGRAKKHNLSKYKTGNKRTVPGCFNLYAICQQLYSLKEAINYLDFNTQFNFCKPMIDSRGNIYPSESIFCKKIGNLHESSIAEIYQASLNGRPCESCGNTVPSVLKERLGWK